MYQDEVDNIIHAGLILIVYLFCAVVLYFVLSSPVDMILGAIGGSAAGTPAETPMSYMLPNIAWAVRVVFAGSFAIPIAWFILWVFSKEPDITLFRR
jgi:hypothetical protein